MFNTSVGGALRSGGGEFSKKKEIASCRTRGSHFVPSREVLTNLDAFLSSPALADEAGLRLLIFEVSGTCK